MNRTRTLTLAALAFLLLGAGLYRLGEEPAPVPVMRTLNILLLHDFKDPARPSFRFAIALSVPGLQADDRLEAEFENPADARQALPGSPMNKAGTPEDQHAFVSPELSGLQCRAYAVTVRVLRHGEPVATRREMVRSRFDAAAIAAGGSDAARRAEQGEAVCGG